MAAGKGALISFITMMVFALLGTISEQANRLASAMFDNFIMFIFVFVIVVIGVNLVVKV